MSCKAHDKYATFHAMPYIWPHFLHQILFSWSGISQSSISLASWESLPWDKYWLCLQFSWYYKTSNFQIELCHTKICVLVHSSDCGRHSSGVSFSRQNCPLYEQDKGIQGWPGGQSIGGLCKIPRMQISDIVILPKPNIHCSFSNSSTTKETRRV